MKKYLVIGNPINHSLSPKLHNKWFKTTEIEAVYDKKKIEEKDLREIITARCPIFGFKFEINKQDTTNNWQNSPTIDKIIPTKGYVKDNIIIVSMFANIIKNSATPKQILKVGNFYKKLYKEKGIKDETN